MTSRSFEAIAIRALARASFHISATRQSDYRKAARLRDERTKLGAHPRYGRKADRRLSLYRSGVTSLAKGLALALTPRALDRAVMEAAE